MPTIYVSVEEGRAPNPRAAAFISAIENGLIAIIRISQFPGYDVVDASIRQAVALVAVVDDVWSSSTWRLSEVTFAAGATPVGTRSDRMEPIPVFIFAISAAVPRALAGIRVELLPGDPIAAAHALERQLAGA